MDHVKWGKVRTTATPTKEAHMMVNLRCHLGSSTYELHEGISEGALKGRNDVLVLLELCRNYWSPII
jgi:hypothetical protein